MTIGTHAEKRHHARPVAANLAGKASSPGDKFGRRQLIGARRGPANQVGEPETQADERFLFRRVEKARREAGAMQRGPETIARTGEVVAGRGGVKAGIDSAEEYLEMRRNDVAQRLAARRLELCGVRPGE